MEGGASTLLRGTPPPRAPAAALLRLLTGAGGSGEVAVLRRLGVADARALRAAHPRAPTAVAAADWGWDTEGSKAEAGAQSCSARAVYTAAARFSAALPRAACGFAFFVSLARGAAATDMLHAVHALPRTLAAVSVASYSARHDDVNGILVALFSRLRELRALSIPFCSIDADTLAAAPSTLRRLFIFDVLPLGAAAPFSHLTQLRSLELSAAAFDDAALACLPPSLARLIVPCTALTDDARFDRLTALRVLRVSRTMIGDDALASAPRGLVYLDASITALSAAARLDHLPCLRHARVSSTGAGDATLASAPCGLRTLDMAVTRLTDAARFDHLRRLRSLNVIYTRVRDAALASVSRSVVHLDA